MATRWRENDEAILDGERVRVLSVDGLFADVQYEGGRAEKGVMISGLKRSSGRTPFPIRQADIPASPSLEIPGGLVIAPEPEPTPDLPKLSCSDCGRTFESKQAVSVHRTKAHGGAGASKAPAYETTVAYWKGKCEGMAEVLRLINPAS